MRFWEQNIKRPFPVLNHSSAEVQTKWSPLITGLPQGIKRRAVEVFEFEAMLLREMGPSSNSAANMDFYKHLRKEKDWFIVEPEHQSDFKAALVSTGDLTFAGTLLRYYFPTIRRRMIDQLTDITEQIFGLP